MSTHRTATTVQSTINKATVWEIWEQMLSHYDTELHVHAVLSSKIHHILNGLLLPWSFLDNVHWSWTEKSAHSAGSKMLGPSTQGIDLWFQNILPFFLLIFQENDCKLEDVSYGDALVPSHGDSSIKSCHFCRVAVLSRCGICGSFLVSRCCFSASSHTVFSFFSQVYTTWTHLCIGIPHPCYLLKWNSRWRCSFRLRWSVWWNSLGASVFARRWHLKERNAYW